MVWYWWNDKQINAQTRNDSQKQTPKFTVTLHNTNVLLKSEKLFFLIKEFRTLRYIFKSLDYYFTLSI